MKLEITEKGVYAPTENGDRRVPVGTVIDIGGEEIPPAILNKCRVVGVVSETAQMIVNDEHGYAIVNKGRGWFVITKGGVELTKSLRQEDVTGFEYLSADEKAAHVEANKAE